MEIYILMKNLKTKRLVILSLQWISPFFFLFDGKSLPPCRRFSVLPSLIFITLFSEVAAHYLAC